MVRARVLLSAVLVTILMLICSVSIVVLLRRWQVHIVAGSVHLLTAHDCLIRLLLGSCHGFLEHGLDVVFGLLVVLAQMLRIFALLALVILL